MTARSIRAGAAVLGGAAVLAVAGCGGGSAPATQSSSGQSTPDTSGQSTPGTAGQGAPGRAGGMFSEANMSALAKDLGVSTTRLQQALAAARPAGAPNGTPPGGGQGSGRPPGGGQGSGRPPGGAGGGGGGAQLAAGLAEQLNLPTDQVQQALAKVLPGRPQGAAPPAASATPTQN